MQLLTSNRRQRKEGRWSLQFVPYLIVLWYQDWASAASVYSHQSGFFVVISGLFFLFYLALGASIFSAIESPIEKAAMEELQKRKADFLQSHSCITGNTRLLFPWSFLYRRNVRSADDAYWLVKRQPQSLNLLGDSHVLF